MAEQFIIYKWKYLTVWGGVYCKSATIIATAVGAGTQQYIIQYV